MVRSVIEIEQPESLAVVSKPRDVAINFNWYGVFRQLLVSFL